MGRIDIQAKRKSAGSSSLSVEDNLGITTIYSDSISTPEINQTSLESIKKNIKKIPIEALELIKKSDIYEYNLKTEDNMQKKHIGFVIGKNYRTPKEIISKKEDSINLYSMCSILWKAVQELSEKIEKLEKKGE